MPGGRFAIYRHIKPYGLPYQRMPRHPPPPRRARALDPDPVDLDGNTPRSRERSDLALALDAISTELDVHSESLAQIGGEVTALSSLAIDTNDKVRELLQLIQFRVMPRLDRVDEIDEVRGRVERLRADFERSEREDAE